MPSVPSVPSVPRERVLLLSASDEQSRIYAMDSWVCATLISSRDQADSSLYKHLVGIQIPSTATMAGIS